MKEVLRVYFDEAPRVYFVDDYSLKMKKKTQGNVALVFIYHDPAWQRRCCACDPRAFLTSPLSAPTGIVVALCVCTYVYQHLSISWNKPVGQENWRSSIRASSNSFRLSKSQHFTQIIFTWNSQCKLAGRNFIHFFLSNRSNFWQDTTADVAWAWYRGPPFHNLNKHRTIFLSSLNSGGKFASEMVPPTAVSPHEDSCVWSDC